MVVERNDQPAATTQILLARHRGGDQAALPLLVERYYPRIVRIVAVRLGQSARGNEIADVVQDVFVRVIQGLEGYEQRPDARWIDWVARLAQNVILNRLRHDVAKKRGGYLARRVSQAADSASVWDPPGESTGVPTKASRAEAAMIVDRCLMELSEAHREVILLREFASADWQTIAEQLGRPTPEACQELHRRARQELAQRLRTRL